MPRDPTITKRGQEPLDEADLRGPNVSRKIKYSSRDAEALRRRDDAAYQKFSRETPRLVTTLLCCAVLYLGVMTMAAGRWTRSSSGTDVTERPAGAALTVAPVTYSTHVEVGLWEVCNCTLTSDEKYFCASQRAQASAHGALSVIMVVCQLAGLAAFLVSSFLVDNKRVEWAVPAAYGLAAVLALVTWIMPAVRYNNSVCESDNSVASSSARSYSDADVVLHWAFGLRIVEMLVMILVVVLGVMRATEKLRMWHVLFGVSVVLSIFSIVTTSTNYWIATPKVASDGTANLNVGPWGRCSCFAVVAKCSDVASSYRAVQAFAIIRLLLQVAQIAVSGVIATRLALPPVVSMALAWVTWLIHLIVWTVAIGTFAACGCHGVHEGQNFDWPFAFDLIAFVVQTGLVGHLTLFVARRRLMAWALQEVMAKQQQPPTEAPRTGPVFDPYDDTNADAGRRGTPTGSSAVAAPTSQGTGSPSRFQVRRKTAPADESGDDMAPTVYVARRGQPSPRRR